MNRLAVITALVSALVAGPSLAATQPSSGQPDIANNALLRRMIALNGDVQSYKATVHLDVALKTFPYISPSLDGNVYFKKPDKEAIVFDTVPALASQFKKVYPRIDPPSRWTTLYDVAVLGDASGVTSFRLVPKRNGRVDHLDVKVDDATATVRSYTWTYKDGGYVTFDQTYKTQSGNYLVDKQSGHVELPSYKADVVSNFSNYQLNVAVEDSVFAEQ